MAWVEKEKPKYIIARYVDKEAIEYAGAETEAEAFQVRAVMKARGGKVDIFEGGGEPKLPN